MEKCYYKPITMLVVVLIDLEKFVLLYFSVKIMHVYHNLSS